MYLLFDIGGTKMRFAVANDKEAFGEPEIVRTPQNFEEAMDLIDRTVNELTGGASVEKTAGGIRRLNEAKTMLLPDFRLPDWSGKPLKERLEEITNSQVHLENDTALVGLGEAVKGAGKGSKIVAYLTVSTGVGGVRIVDKKIDDNSFGFEPGHQVVDLDWSLYPESKSLFEGENFGQLEAYISGASMEKRHSQKPSEVTDQSVWEQMTRVLAAGVANTIVFWSPDVIVIGGGMIKSPGIDVFDLEEHLGEFLKVHQRFPEIKRAELKDAGGLHGALSYLRQLVKI